jgi:hypothetical protein
MATGLVAWDILLLLAVASLWALEACETRRVRRWYAANPPDPALSRSFEVYLKEPHRDGP